MLGFRRGRYLILFLADHADRFHGTGLDAKAATDTPILHDPVAVLQLLDGPDLAALIDAYAAACACFRIDLGVVVGIDDEGGGNAKLVDAPQHSATARAA